MPDHPLVRRRTAVTGALGVAAALVAGCDSGDDIAPPGTGGSPTATVESPEAPERTHDEGLVDDVLAELGAALSLLAAARRFRALRQPLAPLVRAHRRHVEVLEGEAETDASDGQPDATAALLAVRRSERRLQASLADAAGRAESGALARLLASMSASVTQHLTLLPSEVSAEASPEATPEVSP